MTVGDDALHIAEILFESGAVHHRYARRLASDGTHWVRHGLYCEYSERGDVVSEGLYEDGAEAGEWRDFYPNGSLAAQGEYVRGKQHGVWRFWAENGDPEGETIYEHGVVIEERRAE